MKWLAIAFAILIGIPTVVFAVDHYGRYDSWRTLDAATVQAEAINYVERYDINNVGVCVYAVTCEADRAILSPIPDLNAHDFYQTQELIRARRFEGACTGRTANLGLHLVELEQNSTTLRSYQETGRWSFSNDRFIQRRSRFQSGYFSEEPWQRCTHDNFAFTRIDGEITLPPETGID